MLDVGQAGIVVAELARERLGVVVAAAPARRVEGSEPIGPPRLHGLEDLLLGCLGSFRDLGDRR